MLDEFGEVVSAYDLGVSRNYREKDLQGLEEEIRNNPSGKCYDLDFQARLNRARNNCNKNN